MHPSGATRRLLALVALSVCLTFTGPIARTEPRRRRLAKIAELPVRFVGAQPRVAVSINGQTGWFLVDTGAQTSLLFGSALTAFGLRAASLANVTFRWTAR